MAEAFPYLILDARYERVREAGVIVGQAVLIAIGIDWDGRCRVPAVELAQLRVPVELAGFPAGAQGAAVCTASSLVVADDHAGLRAALREVPAEAAYP